MFIFSIKLHYLFIYSPRSFISIHKKYITIKLQYFCFTRYLNLKFYNKINTPIFHPCNKSHQGIYDELYPIVLETFTVFHIEIFIHLKQKRAATMTALLQVLQPITAYTVDKFLQYPTK